MLFPLLTKPSPQFWDFMAAIVNLLGQWQLIVGNLVFFVNFILTGLFIRSEFPYCVTMSALKGLGAEGFTNGASRLDPRAVACGSPMCCSQCRAGKTGKPRT
jgi:hypothetical protein